MESLGRGRIPPPREPACRRCLPRPVLSSSCCHPACPTHATRQLRAATKSTKIFLFFNFRLTRVRQVQTCFAPCPQAYSILWLGLLFLWSSEKGLDFHIRRAAEGARGKVVRPAAAALSWCPVASNVLSPPSRPESPPWTCPPCCTVFKHPRTTMSWQVRSGGWEKGGEEYDAKLVTPLSALNWWHRWVGTCGRIWVLETCTFHLVFSELCWRPAYLYKHDQERCDCWTRWQHLGFQLRLQRECFLPQTPLVLKSAEKYWEESNRLHGRVLIFDELTIPPGLLLRPLLWEKCETE